MKTIQENLEKFYLQVITEVYVKIAVLEICSEKKTRESVVGTFKKYFAGFCQQVFEKKNSEGVLGKTDITVLSH